jgi:hypothetical protein
MGYSSIINYLYVYIVAVVGGVEMWKTLIIMEKVVYVGRFKYKLHILGINGKAPVLVIVDN